MKCSKCSKELKDDAVFCGGCGAKQNNISPPKVTADFSEINSPNIVITPANKEDIIASVKKSSTLIGGLVGAIVVILLVTLSGSNTNFDIKDNVILEFTGADYAVTTPDNITQIGDFAFLDKRLVKNITINNGVTKIGTGAFEGCTSLAMITIPETVTEIGDWILAECWSLTTVSVKAGSYADAWARGYSFHSNINIEYY